ncbi:MAG TPA: alpha/beta hydrolase [Acidimicrobiia bacterium]|nr:alpha/beta hydrolase [Acidimicrobiia bacterium]
MSVRGLIVERDGATLAGSLWLPESPPTAVLLMHPGSGPSNRDNDTYFPPIREHLVGRGIAVASFDKRGVDESTGRWEDAGIVEQAEDARAGLDAVLAIVGEGVPVGVFGHSQGGWVVIEAARVDTRVRFVVANSGPGVTPAEQERYSMQCELADFTDADRAALRAHFDLWLTLAREGVPWDVADAQLAASERATGHDAESVMFVPRTEPEWVFVQGMIDYDPVPVLRALRVPVLGLFGADDAIVPVEPSVAAFRVAVAPELLTIAVLPGGNHRVQHGDPPRLVDGYLDTLTAFIERAR